MDSANQGMSSTTAKSGQMPTSAWEKPAGGEAGSGEWGWEEVSGVESKRERNVSQLGELTVHERVPLSAYK